MSNTTVSVHTLVKNEENFLWYAVSSVIDYVDEILLWDTGSFDKTLQLIKEIKEKWPAKVKTKEVGKISQEKLAETRQKMLEETKADWIMVLDGDEVWWDEGIRKVVSEINHLSAETAGVAVPFYNCVGDIFHYQEEAAGKYNLAGKKGHLNLRFMRNKPGMKVLGIYPYEYYSIDNSRPIQKTEKIKFIDTKYLHLSHLVRSNADKKRKHKKEIGFSFPRDFYYPEAFFRCRPETINSPWKNFGGRKRVMAYAAFPLRKIKRNIVGNG